MNGMFRVLCLCLTASHCYAQAVYPIAPQIGPSCGFFANVPALTLATGVDISASTSFISPIYQLHRGDGSFARSFSKEKFYELFAIPYVPHEIKHADFPAAELEKRLAKHIAESFDPALAKGRVFSMRVIGAFGGPHNALLMGKEGHLYVAHDPFPGGLKRVTRDALARWMLVPSSATRHEQKQRYITQYLEITLPNRHPAPWKKLSAMPAALSIEWNEAERLLLRHTFHDENAATADGSLDARMKRYPQLDFAALAPQGNGKSHRNVIHADIEAAQMKGVLHLAMFTLSLWEMGHRDRVPVLFLRGRPHALTSYRASAAEGDKEATLVFFDGKNSLALSPQQALIEFKDSGSQFATAIIPSRKR